ncbi:uncharacterized protein LOC128891831 isoform X2 [Hylaeus anthracinus]|nr:uncharacterized protein LOC128881598 isoform X3 [Hylaeus volcanicus]XP_053988793.1 uncharacterized protein LOC128881598 isoform X3 [Hylaeus volcanicus]XP_053988794.1 uncharacterized protein LOC128881598 isoform X3 [Hylaeus volcanicus]XP_053988795.1 uncharacterized protein LOC128881598 isoform X3 [Hylaeus volcanicus]XP_053988796.1 uncharacterized protein LOC128881598 isoform X3 [Hylaeus volcanicus]XP_053988797.1 uncharacterized protein LOC128881598 isoform X3 [Hylaeus volcanicus]XP_05400765
MTSLGRGRGRGWAQYDKDSLRKPGESLCTKDTDYANLIHIVNGITAENLEQQVIKFTQLINNDNLVNISNKLHEHAVNNREFGPKLIALCHYPLLNKHHSDENLRKLLISKLQDQYERRIELRQEYTVTQFCNTVSLFSCFLQHIHKHSNLQFLFYNKLNTALLDYMEMLLETASEQEIKTFTEQIIIHGKYIFENDKQKCNSFMIIPRQILIKENLSPETREMLLYSIDLVTHNFNPLPQNLLTFYEQRLGTDFIQHKGSLRAIRGSGAADAANE